MSPKDERAEVDAAGPSIPCGQELILKMRVQVGKSLESNDGVVSNHDIEQNMREIRAILSTNAGIFDRCMCSTTSSKKTFIQHSFDIVEAFKVSGSTYFVTYPEQLEKSFDMTLLSELPIGLCDVLSTTYQEAPYAEFIDYESSFEKSLILHESVLGPFLVKLKDHLMDVQVCLGRIETWVLQAERNTKYLEATFGLELEPPKTEKIQQNLSRRYYEYHQKCLNCSSIFGEHRGSDYRCPNGNCFWCEKSQAKVLKKYPSNFTIEMAFKIDEHRDQKRLEKILEFTEI